MKNVRAVQNVLFEKYRNFPPFLTIVEKKLGETIVSVEDLFKFYGIKSNNIIITTIDKKRSLKRYVLKRSSAENIVNEFRGTELISKYLPVAKVLFTFKVSGESWLLRDYISGVSMADITNYFEQLKKIQQLLELEREKERIIVNGYIKLENKINSKDYLVLPTNKLFHQRLLGERYRDFFIDG
jgi:predicted signal transduction protein with EAL and GGDEF domain